MMNFVKTKEILHDEITGRVPSVEFINLFKFNGVLWLKGTSWIQTCVILNSNFKTEFESCQGHSPYNPRWQIKKNFLVVEALRALTSTLWCLYFLESIDDLTLLAITMRQAWADNRSKVSQNISKKVKITGSWTSLLTVFGITALNTFK